MRIASILLKDFAPFTDTGIRELDVTFSEKVEIIIGTNGSGKSSFLRQLTPIPPTRSMFRKDGKGFKSIVFERDGIYYRLESDFEKPSSPHLFYEGDSEENLNQGRTTDTQRDLVAEHLGITSVVSELIMNSYTFPKWTASARKDFLMNVNPNQIAFVGKHTRDVASKIKACKNNLNRLTERKIILEQQMVDDDTMEALLLEKEQIGSELSQFQQLLMNLEVGTRTLGEVRDVPLSGIPVIQQTIRRCHYRLVDLAHINRDDNQRQRDKEKTLSGIAVCDQQIIEKDEEIARQSAELMEMETRYRELSLDGDLQLIDVNIERLETERDRLQIARPPFELSEDDLKQRYLELDTLRERLFVFNSLTITLLPTKRRQRRERVLQNMQYKQSSWGMRMSELETQYDDLSKRHSLKPSDIPDSPCAKNACPLYSHFMSEYEFTEGRRNAVKASIEKGRRKIARLNLLVGGLVTYLNNARPYTEQIQWLVNYAQSNPVLHYVLRQMDILNVLSTTPNRITRQLQDAYDRIDQWLKLKTVLSDLETARALKSRQISSENHDTIKLVSAIETVKDTLYRLRNDIDDLSERRARLQKLLSDINSFDEIKATMLNIRQQHLMMMDHLANGYEQTRLVRLRQGIETIRDRHFGRLGDIELTLRNQSGIRERYDEEIINQILIIDRELADLQQIEQALIAIARENQIGFINDIFRQANLLISTIWTVPLEIELLSHDDPLNYEFQVSGDNDSVRELSKCSEGQTEILTLAINLALRIVLNHFDFPLMLDETGRTFDEKHRHNLIMLLKRLMNDRVISQLFLVSHHAEIHEAFSESETLVIREDNILLPPRYNDHATFK